MSNAFSLVQTAVCVVAMFHFVLLQQSRTNIFVYLLMTWLKVDVLNLVVSDILFKNVYVSMRI